MSVSYTHLDVYKRQVVMRGQVTEVVNGLFPLYLSQPALLPEEWRQDIEAAASQTELARIVADYVAGMTDRFACLLYTSRCV